MLGCIKIISDVATNKQYSVLNIQTAGNFKGPF